MSRADLAEPLVHYAWLLEISGLTVRYYSGQRPPTRSLGWGGVNYTDLPYLSSIGSQTSKLSALGGVAEQGGINVTVACPAHLDPEGEADPRILLRCGRRDSAWAVRLAATLEHDATAADVVLNKSVTGWPTIGGREVLHVGVETLVAQGGTAAGPPRFVVADRAQLDTRVAVHLYDAAQGAQPWVTSDVVTWTGRRCVLKRAAITGEALTDDDYEEVLRGELDRPPDDPTGSGIITVYLAPLTLALKKRIGGDAAVTGLCRTHHVYTRGLRSTVAHTQIFRAGMMMSQPNTMNDGAAGGAVSVGSNLAMADNVDPTLADGHPRRGAFKVTNSAADTMEPSGAAPFAVVTQIDVTPLLEPSSDTHGGGKVENVDLFEVKAVDLCGGAAEATLEWPNGVADAVNAAWCPGTTAGASGAWADVRMVLDADQPRLEVLRNGQTIEGPLNLEFRSDWGEPGAFDSDQHRQDYIRHRVEVLTQGLDFAAPDEEREAWTREVSSRESRGNGQAPRRHDIRGAALAYCEAGERYFLARSDVLGTISGVKYVQVKWTDRQGEQQTQVLPIVAVTAEVVGGKTIGYRYEIGETVRQQVRTFGDWSGFDACEIRAAARWTSTDANPTTAAEVLLSLLLSGRGNAVNSAGYDRQAFGCNLNEDDVWVDTFLSGPERGPWNMTLADKTSVADFINPILQVLGCALAMVLDDSTGRQRLALVPLGVEFAPDSALTITQAQCVGQVGEPVEAKVTTAYEIEAGYDEATGDPTVKPGFVDADAKGDAGGDAGETLQLKLKGLDVSGATDLTALALSLVSDLRARFGRPRKGVRIVTYHGAARGAALGKVVRLATDRVTGAARVMAVRTDHDRATSQIDMTRYGVNGAGWAAALRVTAVIGAKVVEVAVNRHTLTNHPITGQPQTDLDYWTVGDPVACVPRGDWAGRVQTTITGINTGLRRVTTAANHGLSVGDTLRPLAYDASTAAQQGFVYVADSDERLGAGNDPAKDWIG